MRRLASVVGIPLVILAACSTSSSSSPAAAAGSNIVTASYDGTTLSVIRIAPDDDGPVTPAPVPGAPSLSWQVLDASGTSVASGTIADPTYVTAEFAVDGTPAPATKRSGAMIELRVPAVDGTLTVADTSAQGQPRTGSLAPQDDPAGAPGTPITAAGTPAPVSTAAQAAPVARKVVDNGPCAPFNILFVPEGYQSAELPAFDAAVQKIGTDLDGYKGYGGKISDFNFWVLDVASNDSGITDPGCMPPAAPGMDACTYTPPPPPVKRDTAFRASFSNNVTSPRRVISLNEAPETASSKAAVALLATAKRTSHADMVAYLVNDPGNAPSGFGGAAQIPSKSWIASTSTDGNQSYVATAAHENAHALFGLQDEYSYGATAAMCDSGKSNGAGPLPLVNVTNTPASPPWSKLVTSTTVPTTDMADGVVGAFAGGYYCTSDFYHPTKDCLMLSLVSQQATHGDFCAVCLDHVTSVIDQRESYARCACALTSPAATDAGGGLINGDGTPLVCPSESALVQQAKAAGWWAPTVQKIVRRSARLCFAPFPLLGLLVACRPAAAPPASAPAPQVAPAPGPGTAAKPAAAQGELAATLDAIFTSKLGDLARSPGCAFGVFRAGEIVFARGYGLASLENDVPITPHTSFEIGSMSKQFTATAVLLLAEDGKLSLDDDVRKYIPELPDYGHPITLRQLLHHTGGLREYDVLLDLSGWDTVDVATDEEALRLVTLQKGTNFAPGTAWSYSNTGYFLLGQVVKRVSGKTLAVFSKERIWGPLGMEDTTILDDPARVLPRRATGYSPREGGGFQLNISSRAVTGEGNVQSSIEDLARWDANFYQPKVGGKQWLETMRTPGTLNDGTKQTYAMGLILKTDHGLPLEEHSGGWAGYRSDGRRYPSERWSATVLCNRDDVNPLAFTRAVATAMLPALSARADARGADPAPASPATTAAAAAATTTSPDAFVGAYLEPGSLLVRVFATNDGALTVSPSLLADPAQPPTTMERLGDRSFRVPGSTSRWTFEPASGKSAARVVRVAPGDPAMTFDRFTPQAAETTGTRALASYVGRYTSDELTSDLDVELVDGKLLAFPSGKRHLAAQLVPLSPDIFAGGEYSLVFARAPGAGGKVVGAQAVFDSHRAVRWKRRASAP